MIFYMEKERMESLPEEEINMAYPHKEAVGYVVGELITFFQNSKVRCPFL
jgi:hypothetical protein